MPSYTQLLQSCTAPRRCFLASEAVCSTNMYNQWMNAWSKLSKTNKDRDPFANLSKTLRNINKNLLILFVPGSCLERPLVILSCTGWGSSLKRLWSCKHAQIKRMVSCSNVIRYQTYHWQLKITQCQLHGNLHTARPFTSPLKYTSYFVVKAGHHIGLHPLLTTSIITTSPTGKSLSRVIWDTPCKVMSTSDPPSRGGIICLQGREPLWAHNLSPIVEIRDQAQPSYHCLGVVFVHFCSRCDGLPL